MATKKNPRNAFSRLLFCCVNAVWLLSGIQSPKKRLIPEGGGFQGKSSDRFALVIFLCENFCSSKLGRNFRIKKSPEFFGGFFLSGRRDSNPRPRPWQGRALPAELLSRFETANLTIKLNYQKLNAISLLVF